ncbi:MAG TPA: YiiX/YebB-like N1pC/P60 family cysteine hydrolase [Saccharofermentans sp.]|mgnify:CR=1 FL=1|nr:YiiX/YebB-like N1pC/P60 family cysteine hydrolase [Saccharofermentans sp.]
MNPFRLKIRKKLLTIFGDIKVFKWPMFIVYHPTSFRVKGRQTLDAMHVLKPGDLILRKYKNYLDGHFIPGKYSHTGIYIGENLVTHAIAEGVVRENIIDFLRCDGFCILRPKFGQEEALRFLKDVLGQPYDFEFSYGNEAWYCHELGANAYLGLNIKKKVPKLWFIKGKPAFLTESFLDSPDFKNIMEY